VAKGFHAVVSAGLPAVIESVSLAQPQCTVPAGHRL